MQPQQPTPGTQKPMRVSDEAFELAYSNLLTVSVTPEEFVLHFFANYPPALELVKRIAMSPMQAKRVAKLLLEQIAKYESLYGTIQTPEPLGKIRAARDYLSVESGQEPSERERYLDNIIASAQPLLEHATRKNLRERPEIMRFAEAIEKLKVDRASLTPEDTKTRVESIWLLAEVVGRLVYGNGDTEKKTV